MEVSQRAITCVVVSWRGISGFFQMMHDQRSNRAASTGERMIQAIDNDDEAGFGLPA